MKRIWALIGIFVFTFIFAAGGFMPANETMAAERYCIWDFPCPIDDMVCTVEPCFGTCWYDLAFKFYCEHDVNTMYCAKDFYYLIPCYTIKE